LKLPLKGSPDWVRAIIESADLLASREDVPSPRRIRQGYVEALCQFVHEIGPFKTSLRDARSNRGDDSRYSTEKNLFLAAVYLNMVPIVKGMIDSIFEGSRHPFMQPKDLWSSVFGCPFVVAAKYNRHEILQILLDKVAADPSLKDHLLDLKEQTLVWAAVNGHLETVDLLLSDRWTPFTIRKSYEYKPRRLYLEFLDSCLRAPNEAVFNRIFEYRQNTILQGSISQPILRFVTIHHVERRNVSMVQFLLEKHWQESPTKFFPGALLQACENRHIEMVRLLLRYAAPQERKSAGLVSTAAAGGSLELVKLLLEQGNDIDEPRVVVPKLPPAIVSAVALEHTEMFHFLRNCGAAFESQAIIADAIGRAKNDGLDSMLELLEQQGIDIEPFPPIVPENLGRNASGVLMDM
jgi:hypothetical protein